MPFLSIPLQVKKKGFAREKSLKKSLDESLYMDEHEGVIYNSGDTIYDRGIKDVYNKKISGSSKNMNTFAAELKEVVKNYEKRLSDVAVTMTYIREERLIYVTIKGVIIQTKEDYVFTSTLRVWK